MHDFENILFGFQKPYNEFSCCIGSRVSDSLGVKTLLLFLGPSKESMKANPYL